jgi:hypothetical protein
MSSLTLAKQVRWLSIPLLAAVAGLVLCLLLLLHPAQRPQHLPPPSAANPSAAPAAPTAAPAPRHTPRSSTPVPELAPALTPRPARFMPTGDLAAPGARQLVRFLSEAQLTDAQQQLLFRLAWDAKTEWDLLHAAPRPWQEAHQPDLDAIQFLEDTEKDIEQQLQKALTPEQWDVYKTTLFNPVVLFNLIGPETPGGRPETKEE